MDTLPQVEQLAAQLLQRKWMLVTAESCSGGLIAGAWILYFINPH